MTVTKSNFPRDAPALIKTALSSITTTIMAAPAAVEFTLLKRGEILGPRLGTFVKKSKSNPDNNAVEIATPGLIAMTSRGVVSHLSRDHARGSDAIRWVHVPFETL